MSCYGNSSNSGGCYNPGGSTCYPNTAYLCAPPQPCRQTVFKSGNCNGNGPNVYVTGSILGVSTDGSCTDWTNFQIEGSGLSIVAICVGSTTDDKGIWNVCTAGTICSCPNNFTTTFYLNKFIGNAIEGSVPASVTSLQAVGCVNWCVCGCNVCGSGSFTGIYSTESDDHGNNPQTFSGTINIQGTACSACGTRTICINNINITG